MTAPSPAPRRSRRVVPAMVSTLAVALATVALGAPRPVLAQGTHNGPADRQGDPEWMERWSPLEPFADVRMAPDGPGVALPGLLVHPAPRAGLAWTLGNPAGLAHELPEPRTAFRTGAAGESGGYRRPLDAGSVRRTTLGGFGWASLGESGGGMGRVQVEDAGFRDGAHFDVAGPYGSSPLLIADTAGEDLGRVRARLEGAGGWSRGPWAVGAAAGYTALETRTDASGAPRLNRTARTGVTLGTSYEMGGGARLGIHARYRESSEFIQVFPLGGRNRLYHLQGYFDPSPWDVQGNQPYQRRLESRARGVGTGVSVPVASGVVVAGAEAARLEEAQLLSDVADPGRNTWDADARSVRAAWQGAVGARLALLVEAGWTGLDGEARLDEFDDLIHAGEERRYGIGAEGRWALGEMEKGGRIAVSWHTDRDVSRRRDPLADNRSEIRGWTHALAVEVTRALGERVRGALGVGGRWRSAAGRVPSTPESGPVYSEYVGPALHLSGTSAITWGAEAGLLWQARPGTAFILRGGVARTGPRTGVSIPRLLPEGKRTAWRVELTALLVPAG